MLQSDSSSLFLYSSILGFTFIIGMVMILLAVEFSLSSKDGENLFLRLLLKHYSGLEGFMQIMMVVGFFLICIPFALIVDEIVLAMDMIIFPFVAIPMFTIAIHYRLYNFRDIAMDATTNMPGDTFESLRPTMYARITLLYWVGSLLSLISYFVLSNSASPPAFTSVFLHYGLGGLFFFSSPLLFSLSSLRDKSKET